MTDHPVFAVVGHPNKGKSSVVAALTQNDNVEISPVSGTTREAQRFALKIDGEVMFELVDTPGFQRPISCMAWLTETPVSAEQKSDRLRDFLAHFAGSDHFPDEVELLGPIMKGAGIIYVVDGSLPYSPEYEAEMEILRWSGQPRLALINPIGGSDHVGDWENALNQYFSLVRIFDPLHAGFDQHLQLLHTFVQLAPEQRERLQRAIDALEAQRKSALQQAARIITELLFKLMTFKVTRPAVVDENETLAALLPAELQRFNLRLNKLEEQSRRQVELLFGHHHVNAAISKLQLEQGELMDLEQWSLWGLEKKDLIVASAGAGAAIGLVGDAAVGGHSLMTGTLAGGLIGGISAWLGTDKLKDKLPKALQLSARKKVLGPVKDPNFVFVILGRNLAHARAMLRRSHAERDHQSVAIDEDLSMQELDTSDQIRLLKLARQLGKQGLSGEAAARLEGWIEKRLAVS